MRSLLKALTALLPVFATTAEAGAQTVRDFRFVKAVSPELTPSNPATLALWQGKLSIVEIAGEKGNGELIPLEGSADDFSLKASTESYCRISDKTVFHGRLAWSDFNGKGMSGPILMNPSYNPVNFYENDPSNSGMKKRELYSLDGGLSLNLGNRWSAGARIEYEAGDQTKVKDPRFANVWMDLGIDAGACYKLTDHFTLGASVEFRNTLEQLRGGIFGMTDRQYYFQTDKGGFFGTVSELAGDSNHIPTTEQRPLSNRFIGGSLQGILAGRMSNELTFSLRDGYYGKKASTSAVYFEFSGIELGYNGVFVIPSGKGTHRAALSFKLGTLSNDENSYRETHPAGGNTVIEYTGRNHILDRTDINASLNWRWYHGRKGNHPAVTVGAAAAFFSRSQSTTIYPYYRNQSYTHAQLTLYARKCFHIGKMCCIVDGSLHGRAGGGVPKEDGTLASSSSTTLKSFDYYLERHFEYETAPRAGASAAVTFAHIFGKGAMEPYVRISDNFTTLVKKAEYLDGQTRNVASIAIGCNF